LLRVTGSPNGTGDAVTDAQAEPTNLARADVDVVRAGQQAVAAHEAEALVDDVEDAGRIGVAGSFGLALEDSVDEVLAAVDRGVELELAADLAELGDAHLAQVADVEVVPLAGCLELLLLVVFTDWGATDGHAAARTSVSGSIARIGAVGHGVGATCTCEARRNRAESSAARGTWGMREVYHTERLFVNEQEVRGAGGGGPGSAWFAAADHMGERGKA